MLSNEDFCVLTRNGWKMWWSPSPTDTVKVQLILEASSCICKDWVYRRKQGVDIQTDFNSKSRLWITWEVVAQSQPQRWPEHAVWDLSGLCRWERKGEAMSSRSSTISFPKLKLLVNALNIIFTSVQLWTAFFSSRRAYAGSMKDGAFSEHYPPLFTSSTFGSQGHSCVCSAHVSASAPPPGVGSTWPRLSPSTQVSLLLTRSQMQCLTRNMGLLRCDKMPKIKAKSTRTKQNKTKTMESLFCIGQVFPVLGPALECVW